MFLREWVLPLKNAGGHPGVCCSVFELCWVAGQKERQREKENEDLSAFCFYFSPNKTPILYSELFQFFSFFHPIHRLLTQSAESERMGIKKKRPTTLSFASHTFCWSHLRHPVFPLTFQWALRSFLQQRKAQKCLSFFFFSFFQNYV